MATIAEILEYGPIVFSHEEFGVLITVNGSYFNWWIRSRSGWDNTSCRPTDSPEGLYKMTVSEAMDLARRWFEEETSDSYPDAEDATP